MWNRSRALCAILMASVVGLPVVAAQSPPWTAPGTVLSARVVAAPAIGSCFSVAGEYYVEVMVDLVRPVAAERVTVAIRCLGRDSRAVRTGRRVSLVVRGGCEGDMCAGVPFNRIWTTTEPVPYVEVRRRTGS